MLIVLCLYLFLVWLVFSKLKLLKWGWGAGTVTLLVGAFILAVFLAMFNYLTPSGSLTVISRIVEVTPNVSGQIVSIPVKTNLPVKVGTTLFQIDQAPFQEGGAARCVSCSGQAASQAARFELRAGSRQRRGLDCAACIQPEANG